MNSIKIIRIFLIFVVFLFVVPDTTALRNSTDSANPVKIGLLISDAQSTAAQHGAEMAIRKANERGGYYGRPFKLVVRSMEGPWGTGSKQAVDLIFSEEVTAIMGSHDGRNAHLVEQVCTKARVVFMSVWASDPTLSQAFVPWYFSCVPNDLQQAEILIDEIYFKKNLKHIGLVAEHGYDSELAMKSFIKKIKIKGLNEPVQLYIESSDRDYIKLGTNIKTAGIDGLVFFTSPYPVSGILHRMNLLKLNLPVYGTLSMLDDNKLAFASLNKYNGIIMVSPLIWAVHDKNTFRQDFMNTYGIMPGVESTYAYDGMNILIESILKAGTDNEKLREAIAATSYDGISGTFGFDSKGNRNGPFSLVIVRDGIPVKYTK